jgi:hypothetical protein
MRWSHPPDFERVYELYKKRSKVAAEVRMLELEIELQEKRIQRSHPRNTAIRFLGENEELVELRSRLVSLRREFDEVVAEIEFVEYWKDMFRSFVYMQTKE